MAGEVEKSVNDVEGEFGRGVMAEFPGSGGGDGGTDENFTIGEGDDIGGPGDAEEISVDLGHGSRSEDGNVNSGQCCEVGVVFICDGKAVGKSRGGEEFEAGGIVGGGARSMEK